MAYNNGFPVNYQQYYPTQYNAYPTQMSVAQTQSTQSSIIWVQGEAGAKSYLVAPNTTVQLWDSESQTIYLKSADSSGMPSIKVLDYTVREAPVRPTEAQKGEDGMNGLRDELKGLQKQIDGLRDELEGIKNGKHSEHHADA